MLNISESSECFEALFDFSLLEQEVQPELEPEPEPEPEPELEAGLKPQWNELAREVNDNRVCRELGELQFENLDDILECLNQDLDEPHPNEKSFQFTFPSQPEHHLQVDEAFDVTLEVSPDTALVTSPFHHIEIIPVNISAADNAPQFSPGPSTSSSLSKTKTSGAKTKKIKDKPSNRGNYLCGRCGQPKVNHVCAFLDASTASSATQTSSQIIDHASKEPFGGEKFITVGSKRPATVLESPVVIKKSFSDSSENRIINTGGSSIVPSLSSDAPSDDERSTPSVHNPLYSSNASESEVDPQNEPEIKYSFVCNIEETGFCNPFYSCFGLQ